MNNTIPDYFRQKAVENLFGTATFQNCWRVWQPEIHRILGNNYNENNIIDLGDNLTNIFRTTGAAGRDQKELSAGGTAWESLVCWYLNLCTAGNRIVAFRRMSLVPEPIRNAITVNYGNFSCNTESDITIVIFPNSQDYVTPINLLNVHNGQTHIPAYKKNRFNKDLPHHLVSRDFRHFEIGIIQCKTNWNDNAQIPMLWDMIYSANGFRGRNITIGKNGYNIHDSANFTYSFVTVPSNQRTIYKPTSVSVKRVTNLSGGNYWGRVTVPHVARSIKEIFTNNYQSGFNVNLRTDIQNALPHFGVGSALSYFRL